MWKERFFVSLACCRISLSLSFVPPSMSQVAASKSKLSETRSVEETSSELISLLVARQNGTSGRNDDSGRVKELVDSLVERRVTSEPAACLDGPLFYSNVVSGPPPLWETFGFGRKNIQGQQYRYDDEEGEGSVINYAEVFGRAFHVRAYGTYERDTSSDPEPSEAARAAVSSPLDGLLSILRGPQNLPSLGSASIRCPADFTVTVTKGSIFLLGNRIDIPISGTGYLRVLYADPRLRIFVSPKSTTDDRWEKAGLMVAQVRVDVLDPTFEILS